MKSSTLNVLKSGCIALLLVSVCTASAIPNGAIEAAASKHGRRNSDGTIEATASKHGRCNSDGTIEAAPS